MSEFIERVAHAMEQAMVDSLPGQAQCSRDLSLILARAAIAAMEQPSQKMIEAMWAEEESGGGTGREMFVAAIQAELKPD